MTDKQSIRERVWDRLEEAGLARFPFPPHGRIPNFEDAERAADRAMERPELADADAVKANPDAPQLPLRRSLLKGGTTVYMAVPRLAEERCFVELDPDELSDLEAAPTVSHMAEHGERVHPGALPELDAIVVGSVAVTESGARIGKGEGYSDLEYAVLRELGAVDEETPVVTTVHDEQVVADEVAVERHDVPMDVVCTPTRPVRTDSRGREDQSDGGSANSGKPAGIFWSDIDEERLAEIPVLERLRS